MRSRIHLQLAGLAAIMGAVAEKGVPAQQKAYYDPGKNPRPQRSAGGHEPARVATFTRQLVRQIRRELDHPNAWRAYNEAKRLGWPVPEGATWRTSIESWRTYWVARLAYEHALARDLAPDLAPVPPGAAA